MISGDPAALEAAASALKRAHTGYADASSAVRRHGEHVTADWTGTASEAASAAITTLASKTGVGAVVCAQAASVLLTYASALRTAQGRWQDASDRSDAADRASQLAGRAQDAAHALPAGPGKQKAIDAAGSSASTAQAHSAAAFSDMQSAEQAAQQANETAAQGLQPLIELVSSMSPPPGSAPSSVQAPATAHHSSPWWEGAWHGVEHGAQDAWGGVSHGVADAWNSTGNLIRENGADLAKLVGDDAQIALGALMIAGGATGEVGGGVLDATGVGAIGGVPINIAAAGLIAAGAGVAGDGVGRAIQDGSTPSQDRAPNDDTSRMDMASKANRPASPSTPGYDAYPGGEDGGIPPTPKGSSRAFDPEQAAAVEHYGINDARTHARVVFEKDGQAEAFDVQSGANQVVKDLPGPRSGMNQSTGYHAEAAAAATMRRDGITDATMYLNRLPCRPGDVRGCDYLLPRMIPKGSTLTVYGPDGYARYVVGTGD